MIFKWSEKYCVNVSEIDDQHKQLIDMANRMHDAISAGEGKEVVEHLLADLLEFTYAHFATEENLMRQYKYPKYPAHKIEHDKLNEKVIEFKKEFKEADTAYIPLNLMDFLKEWLADHIQNIDMQYSQYFNDQGLF